MVASARAAEKNLALSAPKDLRRLKTLANTRPSRLDLGLALRAPPHSRRPRHPHERYEAMTSVSGSAAAREKKSAELRNRTGIGKRNASSAKTPSRCGAHACQNIIAQAREM